MVYITDTTQDLTINLLLEGLGTIVSFTADPMTAHPGDPIVFSFSLRNDGDAVDTLFARIVDADTGAEIMPYSEYEAIAIGQTIPLMVEVNMPDKNWNVRLEAGHVE